MFLNGLGALTTAITVLVVLVAKFVEGAWVTLALIPVRFVLMKAVHRQYSRMEKEIELDKPLGLDHLGQTSSDCAHHRLEPDYGKALRFGFEISPEIHAVHVHAEEDECHHLLSAWKELVEAPASVRDFPRRN